MDRVSGLKPDVLLEATLAKRNLGTSIQDAPLVIALGPGHTAGRDAHFVIETNRGHNLGRLITDGAASANTGVPGVIGGYSHERVFRSPADGVFEPKVRLGDLVEQGQTVAVVAGVEVPAGVSGVVRGLIRPDVWVTKGLKIGDVDPRGEKEYLTTISEKARAIGGSVLEAILRVYNT
jgi:xanthine dehydrogenase accessory factor